MRVTSIIIILLLLVSCGRHVAVPDGTPPAPEWLKAKIAEMEDKNYYAGASVVRHEWKSEYYYYINVPLSSCMYCEVYDADGNKIDWTQENVRDYVSNRTNEVLIYKRELKK